MLFPEGNSNLAKNLVPSEAFCQGNEKNSREFFSYEFSLIFIEPSHKSVIFKIKVVNNAVFYFPNFLFHQQSQQQISKYKIYASLINWIR